MATIHVAKTGNDTTGNGSSGTPYLTIGKAITVAVANDTITVHIGTYAEIVTFSASGSSGQPITLTNAGDGTVSIVGVSGSQYCVVIDSKSYITLDGLSINYSQSNTYPANKNWPWVRIAGTASHVIIQNCNFTKNISDLIADYNSGARDPAIRIGDTANNISILTNVFAKANKGVQIQAGTSVILISGNTFTNTVQSCIALNGPSNGLRDVLIYNNIIEQAEIEDGIQFTQDLSLSGVAGEADVSNQGCIIFQNVIRNNGENAIDLKGARYVVIDGNVIYGNIGSNNGGLNGWNRNSYNSITRGSSTSTRDQIIRNNIVYDSCSGSKLWQGTHFYNNTFIWNNRDYNGSGQTVTSTSEPRQQGAFDFLGEALTQQVVVNNIFANHNSASLAVRTNFSRGLRIDFNAHVNNQPASYTGTSWASYTLTNWKALCASKSYDGAEANSFTLANAAAIKFRSVATEHPSGDYTAYNFSLQDDSPCKATGGHVTYANGSGSSSSTLFVDDAGCFTDWMSWTAYGADVITFGGQTRTITDVNYTTHALTLNLSASWADNTPIYFGPSATPNIGAPNFGESSTVEPPPPSTGGGYVVTRVACNTSTGNQTITIPTGLSGTPKALWFEVSYATADGTAASHAVIGGGFADGTNQTSWGVRDENGVTPTDSSRYVDDTACVLILNHTNGAILGRATWVSWTSTQAVINWVTAPATAYLLTVTALEMSNAYVTTSAIHATNNSSVTVTPGFQVSAVIAFSVGKAAGSSFASLRASLGFATYYQSTLTQNCMSSYSADNVATSKVLSRATSSRLISYLDTAGANVSWSIEITNVTSTTFDLTTRGGTPSETEVIGLLCLRTTSAVWTGYIDVPTTAAATQYTTAAFKGGMLKLINTHMTAIDTANVDGNAGGWGLSTFDGTRSYSNAISTKNANSSSTVTKSISNDQPIDLYEHGGTQDETATSAAFIQTGFELTYGVVPGTSVRKSLALLFQTAVSVTAAFSVTPLSGDAPLSVTATDASTANGTTITTHSLDWGDGSAASTGAGPWAHNYTAAGSYTLALTVTDGSQSNTRTRTDYVVASQPAGTAAPTNTLWGGAILADLPLSPLSGGAFI